MEIDRYSVSVIQLEYLTCITLFSSCVFCIRDTARIFNGYCHPHETTGVIKPFDMIYTVSVCIYSNEITRIMLY